jgi:hypothetical protein
MDEAKAQKPKKDSSCFAQRIFNPRLLLIHE